MASRRHFIGIAFGAAICTNASWSQEPADLKRRIRKADPHQYGAIKDAAQWHNPYLLIDSRGVYLDRRGTRDPSIRVHAVPRLLESLPDSAWPLGLVVAVQEIGVRADDGKNALIPKQREELVSLLQGIGIIVEQWPSA